MPTHQQGARDPRGHRPTDTPLGVEPPTLLAANRCRTSDWRTLFAGVSLHHQVLLRSTLIRATRGTSPPNHPTRHR
ncbi:MAG: hypothetical protein HGA45_08245 [Chloroflexales bacterium]|nr:hypothetical protein [Chloroflexales bacterium]